MAFDGGKMFAVDQIWSGYWWTLQAPTPVPGILHKPGGRWRLDLVGGMAMEKDSNDLPEPVGGVLIFGSVRGLNYTIEGCSLSSEYRPFVSRSNDGDRRQWTQTWDGYRVLEGGHVPDGTKYSRIDFRLTGLPDWWLGPDATPITIEVEHGVRLMIYAVAWESHKDFVEAKSRRAQVTIEAPQGIDYARAYQRIVFPMIALLSIALMRECKVFAIHAAPMKSDDQTILFNPGDGHGSEDVLFHNAIFASTDVDAELLLTRWLQLAPNNLRALESAMYNDAPGHLFSDAFDAVSAAEGLDRYLRSEMKRKGQSLTRSDSSLKGRLAGLVSDLGEAVSVRLLGPHSKEDWAYVAEKYRNALGHGYSLQGELQLNPGLSIAVMESTRAVLRSRLLMASGMTESALLNMLSEELVWRTSDHRWRIDWGAMRLQIG